MELKIFKKNYETTTKKIIIINLYFETLKKFERAKIHIENHIFIHISWSIFHNKNINIKELAECFFDLVNYS